MLWNKIDYPDKVISSQVLDSLSETGFKASLSQVTRIKYAIYDNCSNEPLHCEDGFTGGTFNLEDLNTDTYYYLQLWNRGGGQEGTFTLCVYDTADLTVCNDFIEEIEADFITTVSAELMWEDMPKFSALENSSSDPHGGKAVQV